MTTEWKIICDDTTKLLSKNEYLSRISIPQYEGIGIYAFEVPDNFYDKAQFFITAQLNAPNAPENMVCQICNHDPVYFNNNNNPNIKNYDSRIIIGYEKTFMNGMVEKSALSKISKHNSGWKAIIVIKFLIPDDMNNFNGYFYPGTKYVYPGKDWKLTMNFIFEDLNKILERNNIEIQKKLQLDRQIEAEEKQLKATLNDYTYDKLSNYTIIALKKICENHKLSNKGGKSDIIARIINYAYISTRF